MRIVRGAVERLKNRLGGRPGRRNHGRTLPPDFPPEVTSTIASIGPYTMTSPERIYALINAVEYIVANNIPGEIVECGVWRGGSMMAVAETLSRLGSQNRRLCLFDTFDGMPPPAEGDRDYRSQAAADLMSAAERSTAWVWAVAQLADVRQNMRSTGYPEELVRYIEGKVEDTLPSQAPEQIALLRLDTDWYESTRHELEHLFPRLSTGGVLIIDDYGHWQGARRAVDEYLSATEVRCLLCRIDYTGRIAVKQ